MRIGFDNDQYIALQAEHIRNRIDQFGGKLYLEFGGKLFDDYHASRVLPGFEPDSKIRMLKSLIDDAEIIIAINANDIEKSKVRGDLGITYDEDVLRLMDIFRGMGFATSGVVITHYTNQPSAEAFRKRLDSLGIRSYLHYPIPGYPYDIDRIVSDEGYGRNEFIETTRPLVVVTAPGPGSGKMATCLSQLYHEHKRGVAAGYAKYETFPIWNLPLKHPVNIAYEAATVDLNDANTIDPFHLEAYGETTVNYNRDVEIFPVLKAMMERISGESPYQSPTDMGVNMAGNAIVDDEAVREAAKMEIVRRYFQTAVETRRSGTGQEHVEKLELLMNSFTKIDEDFFDELEETLILSDIGAETSMNICDKLRQAVKRTGATDPADVKQLLRDIIAEMLTGDNELKLDTKPSVIMVIGVNGAGKTTTIGKLAANLKAQGKKVVVAAADTFRAAAIDQLNVWTDRAGVDIVKHSEGSDPAAVVFDALTAAKARGADVVLCDTAGRLHNKKNLMEELKKIARVINREVPDASVETLLVLDATTGQNAVNQAKLFSESAEITGIVLTKLDGTAKGGIIIPIKNELGISVKLVGVGEKIDDLQPFVPADYVKALFE
mgnify:CR=1 FL=1